MMKKRVLTVSAMSIHDREGFVYHNYREVPFIRLRGKWLQALGFGIGQKFTVEESEGSLILKVTEED